MGMCAANVVAIVIFIGVGSIVTAGPSAADPYPIRPIRLIVPFPPGAGSDVAARLVAPKLTEAFKQSVVVDNRPGGGGTIGTEIAVRANPDGYTLFLASTNYAANAALYKLPYDPINDVSPIALIGDSGFVVTLHPSVPASSIRALIEYDKAHPTKLNYGSGGTGGSNHLATELFNQMAGTRMTHVPYKGGGPVMSALLGGEIQLFIGTLSQMIPQVKSNRLRGIAVTAANRSNALPDIPTVAETVPGYEVVTWAAILGPKALARDIIARWNNEISRIVQMPDVKERMAANGMEPIGGLPQRAREVLKRDIGKWQKVVKTANIKAEG